MKKNSIIGIFKYSLLLLASVCFSSCQNENDDLPMCDVTGEWLSAYNDEEQVSISTIEFTSEGVYKRWNAFVSKEENSNLKYEGSYTNNGKLDIIYTINDINTYYPRQFHEVWRIIEIDKYMLHVYNETKGVEQTFRKVSEVFNMTVGGKKVINISNVNAVEFVSCDDNVATVNNQGEIYAAKRGSTYIRVLSSEGEFAIKVEVSDNKNIMDDYTRYIGEPIDEVINGMGGIYNEYSYKDGSTDIVYNLIDNVVKRVYFNYFVENRVYSIEADLLDGVDVDNIMESFNNIYKRIESNKPHLHKYQYLSDEHEIEISIDDESRVISYKLLPNDFEKYDAIIKKNIDEVSSWLGFKLSDSDVKHDEESEKDSLINTGFRNKDGNYKYFQDVFLSYYRNSRKISGITMRCPKGVSLSVIERWYDEKYIIHYPNNRKTYAPTNNYLMAEYYIEVYEYSGRVYVQYVSHKSTSI